MTKIEQVKQGLFDLIKDIVDGEWGPYEDDHYWPMVDNAIKNLGINDLIFELQAVHAVNKKLSDALIRIQRTQ